MSAVSEITLYDRKQARLVSEQVFEKSFMQFFYGHPLGLALADIFIKRAWFSILYGWLKSRKSSARQIQAFVEQHGIDVAEVELPLHAYPCFSAFFTRKLKAGSRPVPADQRILFSPADARLSVWKIQADQVLPVKGRHFSLAQLLRDEKLADKYRNGDCLVFRLAPADYHRYIHIDHGMQGPVRRINGYLHSVSPLALQNMLAVFTENQREYCSIQTRNFGEVIQIDVGALVVGRITQHKAGGGPVERGEEKGYFDFGGSTIILLFKAGVINIDADILQHSDQGIETLVRQGEGIAHSLLTPSLLTQSSIQETHAN